MMKKQLKITEIAAFPKKRIVSKLQRYRFQMLIVQIEEFNQDCLKISGAYLLYFMTNSRQRVS